MTGEFALTVDTYTPPEGCSYDEMIADRVCCSNQAITEETAAPIEENCFTLEEINTFFNEGLESACTLMH